MVSISGSTAEIFTGKESDGVLKFENFLSPEELAQVNAELQNPDLVPFWDAHDTYQNARGVTIHQNHDAFALKLRIGDPSAYLALDGIKAATEKASQAVRSLAVHYPRLKDWQPDELSIHRYDKPLGLSPHYDMSRFWGIIAIMAVQGECSFAVYRHDRLVRSAYPTVPGDLLLMRAPGIVDRFDGEIRPEHAVENVRGTRTSIMLRADRTPSKPMKNADFYNWP